MQSVESRIAGAGRRDELLGWRPTLEKPDRERPAAGIPQDIAEHMRLLCDIVVLAFQTDTTRITTLKLNNDHSALRFPNLPKHGGKPGAGIDYMIHHLRSASLPHHAASQRSPRDGASSVVSSSSKVSLPSGQ